MRLRYFCSLTLFALLIYSTSGYSQQDNTLFFLHSIPESNFVNPAVQIRCRQYVGLPLLTTLHLNVNSTGFSYNSFSPGASEIDVDKVVSKMHKWDYLSMEFHYTPISFGFMYDKKQYFNFAWTEKVETKVFFPRELFMLAKDGNTQYVGNGLSTRNPGVNAIYYREFSFGYSTSYGRYATIGGHAKILFGLAGVFTKRKPIDLSTNSLNYNIDASWNPKVNTSLPLDIGYDSQGNVDNVSVGSISPVSFLLNFKNQGLATDLGFIYKKDKITWSGSILDVGLIWWHDQTNKFKNKGNFTFQGATVNDGMNSEDYFNSIRDSIQNQFRFKVTKKGFVTFLNPRIYFGGTYPIHKQINVGALVRSELYPGRPIYGLTLSANAFSKKGSSISVNYSVMDGSFANLGVGIGAGGDHSQFFILSDNVLAFFLPQSARNVNIRFGFNFFMGCTEKKKKYEFPKGSDCGCNWAPETPKNTGKLNGLKNSRHQ
jgi:hypothetical protein